MLMLNLYYVLEEWGNPVIEDDILKWAAWFQSADPRIRVSLIEGLLRVSTVFLGVDHGWTLGHSNPLIYRPILWETMVFSTGVDEFTFGGRTLQYHPDLDQRRYTSRELALAGHQEIVDALYASLTDLKIALTQVSVSDESDPSSRQS